MGMPVQLSKNHNCYKLYIVFYFKVLILVKSFQNVDQLYFDPLLVEIIFKNMLKNICLRPAKKASRVDFSPKTRFPRPKAESNFFPTKEM